MTLKAPKFWQSGNIVFEILLAPFSVLYDWGTRINTANAKPKKVKVPVICVGNLTMGGTGKTPAAIALREALAEYEPSFLLRGYGGKTRRPTLVNLSKHNAVKVGDEAMLLAHHGKTIASPNRVRGAKTAIDQGAGVIIMDDGLQNPHLHKDIKFAVIDGTLGFGNGKVFPAGPLRQSLKRGIKMADAFIIVGKDKSGIEKTLPKGKPVFHARITVDDARMPPAGDRYIAFAGIGYPQKFFSFLRRETDLNIVKTVSFADHHPYSPMDIAKLQAKGLTLLTTEKDAVRLQKFDGLDYKTLPIKMVFDDNEDLFAFIRGLTGL